MNISLVDSRPFPENRLQYVGNNIKKFQSYKHGSKVRNKTHVFSIYGHKMISVNISVLWHHLSSISESFLSDFSLPEHLKQACSE